MYAQNAYQKQRQENLMPGHSPVTTSDEDGAHPRRFNSTILSGGGGANSVRGGVNLNAASIAGSSSSGGMLAQHFGSQRGEGAVAPAGSSGASVNSALSALSTSSSQKHLYGRHRINVQKNRYNHGMAANPGQNFNNSHAFHTNNETSQSPMDQAMNLITTFGNNLFPSNSTETSSNSHSQAHAAAQLSRKRRQTRALIVLASLAFVGMLVLDGMSQLKSELPNSQSMGTNVQKSSYNFNDLKGASNRELGESLDLSNMGVEEDTNSKGSLRKLIGTPVETTSKVSTTHAHRVVELADATNVEATTGVYDPNNAGKRSDKKNKDTDFKQPRALHAMPLLPKHALQHRQRRELIDAKKPIPPHLIDGQEDEKFHAPVHQRRRMYPMTTIENPDGSGEQIKVVDARLVQRRMAGEELGEGEGEDHAESVTYETGAIYQGYGTHYVDLWVGTPPQRQTVIIDTGSSVTAFPCSECVNCGIDESTGDQYHLDPEFDESKSTTYQQTGCRPKWALSAGPETHCPLGTCIYDGEDNNYCNLSAMYAEGSSWTAKAASDIVYPAGNHNEGYGWPDRQKENGVGVGMGDINDEQPFSWNSFRFTFGCQTKTTGLFNTQLEDGIMGMDNRAGAFWLQLHQHYKDKGYKKEEGDVFDPAQFSLCYDRQPLSLDLEKGVGSGQLTFGGSDPLLHGTPMVYADNLTPSMGWYTVRVKGMYLRSGAGRLDDAEQGTEYFRVDAAEDHLNGKPGAGSGIIVDSGTTDTYLSESLKSAFDDAFRKALNDPSAEYHNDPIELSEKDLKTMPTILVVLRGHSKSRSTGSQPDPELAVGMAGHPKHRREMLDKKHPNQSTESDINENDVVVAIPPEHYMEESKSRPGVYIARLYFSERYGAQNIFGSNFMMGHEVLFDNGMGRVGFAESHCNYDTYLSDRAEFLKTAEERRTEAVASNAPPAVDEPITPIAPVESAAPVDASVNAGTQDDLHSSGWNRKAQEGEKDKRFPG